MKFSSHTCKVEQYTIQKAFETRHVKGINKSEGA